MAVQQGQVLAVVGAGAFLTLYNRGIWQSAWGAMFGPRVPLVTSPYQTPAQIIAGNQTGGLAPFPGDATVIGGTDQLSVAEGQVSPTRTDWIGLCLQWYDDVKAKIGQKTFYGVPNASTACASQKLNGGPAPRGSGVCFKPTATNPDGHIGISNGGCSYTSVGINHGGTLTTDYCNNPLYAGWF